MESLLYRDLTGNIIGAAMEVHRILGCGFLEPGYQEAFSIELEHRTIPHLAKAAVNILYKGKFLEQKYKPDVLVDGKSNR